jgi:hypothetical protein
MTQRNALVTVALAKGLNLATESLLSIPTEFQVRLLPDNSGSNATRKGPALQWGRDEHKCRLASCW